MMNPIAAYILNQEVLRLLHQREILEKHSKELEARESMFMSSPNTRDARSGVYFNDREVPLEMHFLCASNQAALVPKLPTGKPMPQPPRLMMPSMHHDVQSKCCDKREACPVTDSRPTKRLRAPSQKDPLTSEQQVFIEAALALSGVKTGAHQTVSKVTPTTSPKFVVCGALPPPPFSLSKRVDIAKSQSQHLPKTP